MADRSYSRGGDPDWEELDDINDHIAPQQGNRLDSIGTLWIKEDLAFSSHNGADGSLLHAYSEVLPPGLCSLPEINDTIPLASQYGQVATKSFTEYNINATTFEYADNGHNNVESNKPMQDDLFYNDLRNDKEQYEIVSDSTYGERRNSNSDLQFPPLELSTNGPSMINEQSYSDYQSAEQMHDVGRKTYSYMHYDSPRNLPIFKHPMQVQSSFPVIHTVLSKENNDMGQKDLLEKQGAGSLSQTAEGGSIDSFVVHKSSLMPSVDDISSAINSFKQLQNAIGQA